MAHDDALGEEITEEEEFVLKALIVERMTGQAFQEDRELRFPGSQPVSLARSNLDLLNQRRYWVTWKVDPAGLLSLDDLEAFLVENVLCRLHLGSRCGNPREAEAGPRLTFPSTWVNLRHNAGICAGCVSSQVLAVGSRSICKNSQGV